MCDPHLMQADALSSSMFTTGNSALAIGSFISIFIGEYCIGSSSSIHFIVILF
jgi:hypothetical protein